MFLVYCIDNNNIYILIEDDMEKKDFILAILSKKAYQNEIVWPGYDSEFFSVTNGTQFHILTSSTRQIVCFRGTENNVNDIKTGLKVRRSSVSGYPVHRGFLDAYRSVEDILQKNLSPDKEITFTGHSLGGALAILSCCLLDGNSRAVSFGAPRVFGRKGQKAFRQKNITRYETSCDPVPFLPPYLLGYRHVGDSVYLNDEYRSRQVNPSPLTPFFDMLFSNVWRKASAHSIRTYIRKLGVHR